jgi:hypothetical protein
VSATIDRVHFYERQYLRAYDLTAEQLYHMEMRRRLNLALHLWGIVDGLDLLPSETVDGLAPEFHIGRGMAIDGFGREIVVPANYTLREADLQRNRIQTQGSFFVSVAYRRELSTPPASGYVVCDLKDQYTRWRESFEVLITADDPSPPPDEAPGVADPLSDDPAQEEWPVLLGTLTTTRSNGRLVIDSVKAVQRTYVGLRAQRVVTPASSVSSDKGEAALPLSVGADLLATKNAFVGSDFAITNTSLKPPPADPTKTDPPGTGVLKVADDMFVQGDFYARIAGDWVTMKEYLQSFIPDVKVGRMPAISPVAIATSGGADATTGDVVLELETRLQNPQEQLLMVAIASVDWINRDDYSDYESNSDSSALVRFRVDVDPAVTQLAANKYRFTIHWSIEPTSSQPPNAQILIRRFELSYTAVFNPDPNLP